MHDRVQRWLSRVLSRLLSEQVAEALVGDLAEEYEACIRTIGGRRAAMWYSGQVVRSVGSVLWMSVWRRDWILAALAGFVAFLFAAMAEVAACDAVELVATGTPVDAIPVLLVYLGWITVSACVAERVRSGAATALALLVTLAAILDLVIADLGMPLWYRLAVVIAAPAAAFAGHRLLSRWARGASALLRRKTLA